MRIERKYFFKKHHLTELLEDLKIICIQFNKYKVTSIYFDNIYESSYLQKVNGDKDKIKIRARYYNDSFDCINFEAKIKYSDKSYKLKTCLTENKLKLLLNNNYLDIEDKDCDLAKIYYYLKFFGMTKYIDIEYQRIEMTLVTHAKIRLTIDYDVFSALNIGMSVNKLRCVDQCLCIFEIKADNNLVDKYIKFILEKYKMREEAISKYSLGVQAQKLNMCVN